MQADALALFEEAAALLKKQSAGAISAAGEAENSTTASRTPDESVKGLDKTAAKDAIKVSVDLAKAAELEPEGDFGEAPSEEDELGELDEHLRMFPPHERRKKGDNNVSLKDLPAHPGPPPVEPLGDNGLPLYMADEDRMNTEYVYTHTRLHACSHRHFALSELPLYHFDSNYCLDTCL